MDDEEVDSDAVGDRQGGAHSEEGVVIFAAPGDGFVDRLHVVPDALKQFSCFLLVDLEAPFGRMVDELERW